MKIKKKYYKSKHLFALLVLLLIAFLFSFIVNSTVKNQNVLKTEATFRRKNNTSNKLVIDGLSTKRGDWPFIVALFDIKNFELRNSPYHRGSISYQENIPDGFDMTTYNKCADNLSSCPSNIYYRFLCSGSLISNEWILTAEHCVYNFKKNKKNIGIAIGLYDLKHDNIDQKNSFVTEVSYEDIIIHDDICRIDQPGQVICTNDIALIRIKNPLNIGKTISLSNQDNFFINKNSLFLGWGFNTSINMQIINEKNNLFTNRPYKILRSEKFLTSEANLNNKYNHYYKNKNIIEVNDGTNALCNGDSGGPMVSYDKKVGSYYLTGIISLGYETSESDPDNASKTKKTCINPSYIVNVSKYSDWIMDKTKNRIGLFERKNSISFDSGTFTNDPLK
jgi:secreted trypsin-like serine protease